MMFQAYVSKVPRLDLPGALELGRALLVATEMVAWLPDSVLQAKLLLEKRLDKLTDAASGHLLLYQDKRSPIALAGRNLDAAWMALEEWLESIASLPAHIGAARSAVEALAGIFPEGVGLVRPPPLLEWAESEARLERIERGGFEATLRVMGGGPFLETIGEAHATYQRLLGDTTGGALSSRAVKQSLDVFVLAIHAYVTNVLAELYTGDSEAMALACTLLAPLDFATAAMGARLAFFDRTLEAHPPPPPPMINQFDDDEAWNDLCPIAFAS